MYAHCSSESHYVCESNQDGNFECLLQRVEMQREESSERKLPTCTAQCQENPGPPLLSLWCGIYGMTLSLGQGRCKKYPYWRESQRMDCDPCKSCHIILLQLPRKITGIFSVIQP